MAQNTALIAGVSGIVGGNLARLLAGQPDWHVYGLARNPAPIEGVGTIKADLLNPDGLRIALEEIKPTHVFITSWLRQPTEAENIEVNSAMVRNLLAALTPSSSVQHVALV